VRGRWLGRPRPTRSCQRDLIVLWEMSPLRREARAGARLWVRGLTRRGWVATGPWAQTEARGGLARGGWLGPGPRARCGAAGGVAAASQGYLLST
jgi:hypothetical protein